MPTDPRLRHIQWVAIKPGRPTGCGFFTLNANKWKRVDIVTTTLPLWWIRWRHTILFTVWLMLQIRWNSLECFKNNIALSVLKALAHQQQFVTLPANKLANKSRMRLICTSVISVWFFFHNVLPPSPFFSDIKNIWRGNLLDYFIHFGRCVRQAPNIEITKLQMWQLILNHFDKW